MRLWASPDRCRFVRGALNVIDLAAILPYYVSLSVDQSQEASDDLDQSQASGDASALELHDVTRLVQVESRNYFLCIG